MYILDTSQIHDLEIFSSIMWIVIHCVGSILFTKTKQNIILMKPLSLFLFIYLFFGHWCCLYFCLESIAKSKVMMIHLYFFFLKSSVVLALKFRSIFVNFCIWDELRVQFLLYVNIWYWYHLLKRLAFTINWSGQFCQVHWPWWMDLFLEFLFL